MELVGAEDKLHNLQFSNYLYLKAGRIKSYPVFDQPYWGEMAIKKVASTLSGKAVLKLSSWLEWL